MNLPREGSRVIREGIIVSEPMDWCRSPSAIVPYRIYTDCQVQGANNADSVRQTDAVSHVSESLIRQCYGDEPGTGGGVISGTHNAECTPKTWSSTVRAEDRNMVRHDDEWWMNHKNTWGRLAYLKNTKDYETPKNKDIKPLMDDKRVISDADPDPIEPGQKYAQAGPMSLPGAGRIPPPLSPEASKPVADAIWKGVKGLAPDEGETFSEYMQRPLYNLGIKKRTAQSPAATTNDVGQIRVSQTCRLVPWKDNVCPSNWQRHHVVAGRTLDGNLSRPEGLTLCLRGNAFPRTLLTGHSVAQAGYDASTRLQAAASPDGKLSLGAAEMAGAVSAATGARADGFKCDIASLKTQLRSYHNSKDLPASLLVKP